MGRELLAIEIGTDRRRGHARARGVGAGEAAPSRSCSWQSSDPVGQGFVASLARPGGNATGFTFLEFSVIGKLLEVLKQIAPSVARVALPFNPDTLSNAPLFALGPDGCSIIGYRADHGANSQYR